MGIVEHAKREFFHAGWTNEAGGYKDEMQKLMCDQVLELIDIFANHGHSGSSAPYALSLFDTLARFKPIGPLTGVDSEWNDISSHCGGADKTKYQNKRCGTVFKDADGNCYNIDGRVFWEWCRRDLYEDEEGYPGTKTFKSYYTSRDSRVPVTFPYHIPKEPEYVWRHSDAVPQTPTQTEEGFI
jgi:hypothetical protein